MEASETPTGTRTIRSADSQAQDCGATCHGASMRSSDLSHGREEPNETLFHRLAPDKQAHKKWLCPGKAAGIIAVPRLVSRFAVRRSSCHLHHLALQSD